MLDIGERLPEPRPGAFLGPEWTISRIAYQVLKREPEKERITKLETILKGARGLRMPTMFIGINTNPQDRQNSPQDILIPDDALPSIKAIALDKIRKEALEGRLLDKRDLVYILFRWRDWSADTEPRQWATNVTGSPEGALAFLRTFLHKGTSQTIGDHVARINYFMRYSDLEHFVDVYALEKQIDRLSEVRLPELDRKVVQEFRKAVARKRSGKKEGDFGWDPE